MKTVENAPFKVGDHVVDGDGYAGTVRRVICWEGSRWYEVYLRLARGEAVRFDGDLRHSVESLDA
jgi:hypothetical protein